MVSGEEKLEARIDKVIRDVELLLVDLEALRDSLSLALAESRVARNEERVRDLDNLSGSLRRTYEALREFYRQLSLVRLKYS